MQQTALPTSSGTFYTEANTAEKIMITIIIIQPQNNPSYCLGTFPQWSNTPSDIYKTATTFNTHDKISDYGYVDIALYLPNSSQSICLI